MKRMMYRLSDELIKRINQQAKAQRIHKSKVVEDALRREFNMKALKNGT